MENTTTNPVLEPSNGADKVPVITEDKGPVTGVRNPFVPVTDLNKRQLRTIESVSSAFADLYAFIGAHVFDVRERQLAFDALLTAKHMTVQAITHG